jgi:ferredoxin
MVDGLPRLISEKFCDGYGACISECKPGALSIESREAKEFDSEAARINREKHKDKSGESVKLKWPFKLNLVSADAPFFKDTDLYIVSDCVPFSMKNFHDVFMKEGTSLIVSCPKFDSIEKHREKLEKILTNSKPKGVTIVHMEIPCCNDIYKFIEDIIKTAKLEIPLHRLIISTDGDVKIIY